LFILAADINNDGNADLIATNTLISNTVNIVFGNGNGSFGDEIMYTTGISPMSVAVGAFRDKSKLDLVVANANDNDISLFFNSCP